jgi:hypothetical protein
MIILIKNKRPEGRKQKKRYKDMKKTGKQWKTGLNLHSILSLTDKGLIRILESFFPVYPVVYLCQSVKSFVTASCI